MATEFAVLYFLLHKSREKENIPFCYLLRCTHIPIVGGHHIITREARLNKKRVMEVLQKGVKVNQRLGNPPPPLKKNVYIYIYIYNKPPVHFFSTFH